MKNSQPFVKKMKNGRTPQGGIFFLTHTVDAQENIVSPACLTVFVKSKTENQLIRFFIAYLVADNNVKCETVAATRDCRLHHSRPMAS